MSAWIVSKPHIDVVIKAALVHSPPSKKPTDNLDELGRMLWLENRKSVAYRYQDSHHRDLPGPIGLTLKAIKQYTYEDPGFDPTRGEAASALGCLNYQSCEHPGWKGSAAYAFTHDLVDRLGDIEYEGPWGWNSHDVETRRNVDSPVSEKAVAS